MKQEKLDKIMNLYNRYWDSDEIDIDLANTIVDSVPELVSAIEKLKEETGK